jgi:two-component system, OmpR family, phosphate regulon response regulator PhoB
VASVLIVDDERDLVEVLAYNLRRAGFEPLTAASCGEAIAGLAARVPDLVLLDVMLPDGSGVEVLRALRAEPRSRHVPVIMLTARGAELDRVLAFELGADDYVTKPFSVRELVLRVGAVLRRTAAGTAPAEAAEASPRPVGPIRVDLASHRAFVAGEEIVLTALEFRLLVTLLSRVGRVQSRERLLSDVWGVASTLETRTVDTHVKRLREKLGPARDQIETVRGIGYRLVAPGDAGTSDDS